MRARITRMPRNNTQIGSATTADWVLDFEPGQDRFLDPLMGWTGSRDTQTQVRLTFDSKEAAQAYALRHGIDAVVIDDHPRRPNIRPGGYGENFSTARRMPWTH
ncbi:ETC complex I subunit [Rubellimicrobium sp. CFH 75288]|uniref:ETC complex I subunit n=1 Tax=Rubellimicrobium sp. CFH 75288 TaxID=2697034 RepID=UPI0014125B98|nr:ETC complex I subunit [Rubellimicrobium sp. CFH 75288]NAZ37477.1 ETC complex I subunit [Rubellimicrobium sp. CFH 75288]